MPTTARRSGWCTATSRPSTRSTGVVTAVAAHRAPGAEPHPLNRLGAERALRAAVIADPALVGARSLRPGQPPVARTNVKDAAPCVAVGESEDGSGVVVVCSVGVDLDVVPYALDAWLGAGGDDARLVVALPARDLLPVTAALAGWAHPRVRSSRSDPPAADPSLIRSPKGGLVALWPRRTRWPVHPGGGGAVGGSFTLGGLVALWRWFVHPWVDWWRHGGGSFTLGWIGGALAVVRSPLGGLVAPWPRRTRWPGVA